MLCPVPPSLLDDPKARSRTQPEEAGWGIPQWGPSEWVCQPPWAILQVIWGTLNFPLRWKLPHSLLPNCATVRLGGKCVLVIQDIPPGSVILGAVESTHSSLSDFPESILKPLPCSA